MGIKIKLNLIVAASENMGIGKNGDLPWRLSRSDLKLDQYQDTFSFKTMKQVVEKLENKEFQRLFEGVWVIGGASLYEDAMSSPYFSRLYLTKIHKQVDCDTFLPALPENLKKVSDPEVPEEIQEENGIQYSYHIYEK
ncbi:unnamed protein product [Ceutorhynchus assimilis]|uniref:dihydrofolate reductase n=1 Tax=Ceutorhynchus assimilis TaxID=467358 RepID=A0A9P0GS41_9CUCU|nr:unnamed protein product [Ceutorhynchus assimilis]